MPLKNIANADASLSVAITGGSGSANITSVPSTKVKAKDKGVHKEKIDFTIPTGAGIPGTCVSVVPFNGSISPILSFLSTILDFR